MYSEKHLIVIVLLCILDHSRPLISKEREEYKPLKTRADGKKLINRLVNVLPNSVLRKGKAG